MSWPEKYRLLKPDTDKGASRLLPPKLRLAPPSHPPALPTPATPIQGPNPSPKPLNVKSHQTISTYINLYHPTFFISKR